jgi:AhpD family alkylhydroperoxidase
MSQKTLTDKQKELVAVGASIAAGCRPCTTHHVAAARATGAADDDIRAAVDTALAVRDSARNGMAAFADGLLGGTDSGDCGGCRPPRPLLDELVSVAAACAVNSVADLETHLAHARSAGATEAQISITLSIARVVRRVATEKIELALKDSPDDGSGPSGCSVPDTASAARGSCG